MSMTSIPIQAFGTGGAMPYKPANAERSSSRTMLRPMIDRDTRLNLGNALQNFYEPVLHAPTTEQIQQLLSRLDVIKRNTA